MILYFIPHNLRDWIHDGIHTYLISDRLDELDDVDNLDKIDDYKYSVIDKIQNSKIITNKEDLINRVNNISYKYHDDVSILSNLSDNTIMAYFYDKVYDIDYIIVKDTLYTYNKESITHELNHLVDTHKEVNIEISPRSLIRDYHRSEYIEFYESWYQKNEYDDQELYISEDDIILGDIIYNIISSNPTYYLSDSEIYARLSNMKTFMIDKGALSDINEPLTEELILLTINSIKYLIDEKIENGEWDRHQTVDFILQLDWIVYVSIINYDNIDQLNLIL